MVSEGGAFERHSSGHRSIYFSYLAFHLGKVMDMGLFLGDSPCDIWDI